jgi:CBS domain containing-hemolysin-like protein
MGDTNHYPAAFFIALNPEGAMPTLSEPRLSLAAASAADLMTPDVSHLSHTTTFDEAVAFFIDRNVTVAPVLGERGEPLGVLSATDLLIHVRASAPARPVATATAADLMTPTLFSVPGHMPASDVVQDMLRSQVHHLFVTDEAGTIVGVVSTCDVLRQLRCEE